MYVNTKKIIIRLFSSYSLKDKRSVVKSMIHKIRNQFNVSIAEVDDFELLNQGAIGISIVSNNSTYNEQVFNRILQFIENSYGGGNY